MSADGTVCMEAVVTRLLVAVGSWSSVKGSLILVGDGGTKVEDPEKRRKRKLCSISLALELSELLRESARVNMFE